MCEHDTAQEWEDHVKANPLSRRHFMAISAGLSLASLLEMFPVAANAADVKESDVTIKTPDGMSDCYFVHPAQGASAAVLVWPDVLGLRPAFRAMGKRLAENGYAVLVVNPYYRTNKSPVIPEGATFDDKTRPIVMPLLQKFLGDVPGMQSDAKTYIAWLDQQAAVDKKKKIATTGYCMGGPPVLRTAGVSDRIGAGATFHGAALVAADANSPHLAIAMSKAGFLIAIADGDDKQDPKAKDTLKETFAKNGQKATVEVYIGCAHGWTVPDFPVYDKAGAEKAWTAMLALFKTNLA
ncbi:MAG TPA: dienelactone hydrolase family protein [Candidatus Acidoferrum sp.]|nr:dienelactone hydrolase family protein [Candidatus Acidoferrum sp.]